jgi:hypothetical protein
MLTASLPLALCSTVGCSGDDGEADENTAGTGGIPGLNLGGTQGLGNVGTGGGAVVGNNGNACTIEDDGSGCVGQAYEGESIPLDIYIMFDQSGSMCICVDPEGTVAGACPDPKCNATRMDAVREAARLFMNDPESRGVGIGLGYFGKHPFYMASCDAADYEEAAVEIGVLPGQAEAMMDSLDAAEPTGETPTGAAIRGACSYTQAWKTQNPGHETVILLLTDGRPEAPRTCGPDGPGTCCPTIDDAVEAAGSCLEGDPGIRTYVLGVGPMLDNLDSIAAAGGTERAYLVEGGDVANQVLEALRTIRGDAIPCTMGLPTPPGGLALAYDEVNITYASPSCEPTYYSYVETIDSCPDEGGWYYDDPNAPENIKLCPTSCDQVSVPGGKLVFTVGCETRTVPK